jgi:hypothetical protein
MPAPTKLFRVDNGNGAVINAETITRGTVIWYRDNAAKQSVIADFCDAYGYQATVPDPARSGQMMPNPVSQQDFFNEQLRRYLREVIRGQRVQVAANSAGASAGAAADADLP